MHDVKKFFWDETYLFHICADGIIRHCVLEVEMMSILKACNSSPIGWHHSGILAAHRILKCRYYCPKIYEHAHEFAKSIW